MSDQEYESGDTDDGGIEREPPSFTRHLMLDIVLFLGIVAAAYFVIGIVAWLVTELVTGDW